MDNWKREFITCLFNCLVQFQKSKTSRQMRFLIKDAFEHVPKKYKLWICPLWLFKYKKLLKIREDEKLSQKLESLLYQDREFIDNILKHSECLTL